MKCPACWAEKAYRRSETGAWATLLRCLLFVPMRCRHCYHKFWVHRAAAIGQRIDPPAKLYTPPAEERESMAAQYVSQLSQERDAPPIARRRAA